MTSTIDRGVATAVVARPATPPKTPAPGRPKGGPGFFRSSNGKKAVMAVTGAILVIFLITHVLGNLKIFLGAEAFNANAEWLRTVGAPVVPGRAMLTLAEIVLAVAVVLHMWSAVSLARRASRARPVKYVAKRKTRASGYVVHTMRYGGVIILLFAIWHLLDLTFGVVNPKGFSATPYDRVVAGFDLSRWWVTASYIIAVVMVGLHLRHGMWSAFQTLGLANGRSRHALNVVAGLISAGLVLGFVAVPIAVMIGAVK